MVAEFRDAGLVTAQCRGRRADATLSAERLMALSGVLPDVHKTEDSLLRPSIVTLRSGETGVA